MSHNHIENSSKNIEHKSRNQVHIYFVSLSFVTETEEFVGQCWAGVSNISPQSQNLANKDSNQAHWTAFENVKGCIDFILSTVFAYML